MTKKILLLRIEAPTFVAAALWERASDDWRCVEAAPIIKWMEGKTALQVKAYIDRRRWRYEWLKEGEQ